MKIPLITIEPLPPADSPRARRLLLIFLIVMFLVYDALIWATAGQLQAESKFTPVVVASSPKKSQFEEKIETMVDGHPMEQMAPYISRRDKEVASFLVAIAKKESNWGKFSPKKQGKECYNYWGYRGTYNKTQSGYSCFDSPEQAIEVVGNRIEELLNQEIDTPGEMVIWKCGKSCAGHGDYNVKKWIQDVDLYFQKLY